MLLLGDYTDRGTYGAEVIYAIARLTAASPPGTVLAARGNHEQISQNANGGFLAELLHKYDLPQDASLFTEDGRPTILRAAQLTSRMYDSLPVAVFFGVRNQGTRNQGTGKQRPAAGFVQGCHGGLEVGFDPGPLLSASDRDAHVVSAGAHAAMPRAQGGVPGATLSTRSDGAISVLHAPIVSLLRSPWLRDTREHMPQVWGQVAGHAHLFSDHAGGHHPVPLAQADRQGASGSVQPFALLPTGVTSE